MRSVAEVLTQLAPRSEQAHGFRVAYDRWPDLALALARLLVAVADSDLEPAADPSACRGDVESVNGHLGLLECLCSARR
jgi:hypothetical protein